MTRYYPERGRAGRRLSLTRPGASPILTAWRSPAVSRRTLFRPSCGPPRSPACSRRPCCSRSSWRRRRARPPTATAPPSRSCSCRPTTPGTRRSTRCRSIRTPPDYIAHMSPATGPAPGLRHRLGRARASASPTSWCRARSPRCRSPSTTYGDESDPGPYPIPPDAPVEGAGGPYADGDRHVLVLDADNQKLYEVYDAHKQADGSWKAGSGAVFDLTSNALRPDGWTSADAAGLPILPGTRPVRRDRRRGRARPRAALHGGGHAARLRLPGDALRQRLRGRRTCRRWGCACGCAPTST